MAQMTCKICGKPFEGYPTKRYCSEECMRIAQKRRAEQDRLARKALGKTCVVCGTRFYPEHRGRKTCSDECASRWEAMRKGYKVQIGSTKNCEVCGTPFIIRTHNARYCSPECARKRNHQQIAQDYKGIHEIKKRAKQPLPKTRTLEEVVRKATKRGLTYGQYVSRMKYGK